MKWTLAVFATLSLALASYAAHTAHEARLDADFVSMTAATKTAMRAEIADLEARIADLEAKLSR